MDIGVLTNAPSYQFDEDSQDESDDETTINGAMRVGELQDRHGITSKSYLSFMRQNGPHVGSSSNTYYEAHKFFFKREAQGLKIRKAKKAPSKANENTKYNVDEIGFPVNANGDMEVYDSCNDIRTKILAHLRISGMTQAAFLRMIAAASGIPPIQSKQLTDFTRRKGPLAGNTSKVYYAAYVYFEKLRLKNKKLKGKKRLEMEDEWADQDGVDTTRVANGKVRAHESEGEYINDLGALENVSAGGSTRVVH